MTGASRNMTKVMRPPLNVNDVACDRHHGFPHDIPRPPALVQEQVARDREEVSLGGGEAQPVPRVPYADERLRHEVPD
jgi:hypothetical protein